MCVFESACVCVCQGETRRYTSRQEGKWKDVQIRLAAWIRNERSKGCAVSTLMITVKAKCFFLELRPSEYLDFKASPGWLDAFFKRHKFAVRRKTNGKTESVEERLPGIKRFHARLRERLINDQSRTDQHDRKWGAYKPINRYNVDQVPMPLFKATTTVDEKGAKRVHIRGTKNDDSEKRFCTLQVCVRFVDQESLGSGGIKHKQPRLTICFRGTGKRISALERSSYHPDINVQFQVW